MVILELDKGERKVCQKSDNCHIDVLSWVDPATRKYKNSHIED